MIERFINNYLSTALIRVFRQCALLRYIDLHVIPRTDIVTLYAKDKRFTENLYKEVFSFRKDASIYYLCNLKDTNKEFDEILKKYQETEVRK
jgi:hypothetical protein